ncbi:MAG: YgjV family protein [Erysipelotrichaceae bacterium]
MLDTKVIIANIITVVAQVFLLYASRRKTKKDTVLFQMIFLVLINITNILLNSVTAVIVNSMAILRNLLAYYDKSNNIITVIMVVLSTTLGLLFNNNGFFGIFPVIANIAETVTILNPKSTIAQIKISGVISNSCWVIMTIAIKNYVGTIFDFCAAVGYASYFFPKSDKTVSES